MTVSRKVASKYIFLSQLPRFRLVDLLLIFFRTLKTLANKILEFKLAACVPGIFCLHFLQSCSCFFDCAHVVGLEDNLGLEVLLLESGWWIGRGGEGGGGGGGGGGVPAVLGPQHIGSSTVARVFAIKEKEEGQSTNLVLCVLFSRCLGPKDIDKYFCKRALLFLLGTT